MFVTPTNHYNSKTYHLQDAETILLQAGLTLRAILLNVYLHKWERALDLAIRHKTHVDTVLAYRLKHLERCQKEETIKKYTQYMKEVEIDWEQIAAKLEDEFVKERDLAAANNGSVSASATRGEHGGSRTTLK